MAVVRDGAQPSKDKSHAGPPATVIEGKVRKAWDNSALISCSRHAGTNIRARTNFHQTLRSIVTSKQAYKSFDKRKPGWINVKLEPATEASLAA